MLCGVFYKYCLLLSVIYTVPQYHLFYVLQKKNRSFAQLWRGPLSTNCSLRILLRSRFLTGGVVASFRELGYQCLVVLLYLLFSSDEFIQAQQQMARWASEDAVGQAGGSGVVGGAVPREYFPSPSSSTSEEPPSIVRAPVPPPGPPGPPHPEHATIHRPKRYPEYKH